MNNTQVFSFLSRPVVKMALFIALLISCVQTAQANNAWELKRNGNGIKIYTRNVPGSDIKEIKADFEVKGDLTRLRNLLTDISAQKDWVYSTEQSKVLKRINENELVYYSEKKMPWPVNNRDVVMHVKVTENPSNGTLTMNASAIKDATPVKKSTVRITLSEVQWKVTKVDDNTLRVAYWAKADPGGSIPAWVTNMFLTKGPYESFVNFKKKMENP